MSDEELEVVTAYTMYQWDCPACGWANGEDFDLQGEEVDCGGCHQSFYVEHTI
jgi:hypothetical protein